MRSQQTIIRSNRACGDFFIFLAALGVFWLLFGALDQCPVADNRDPILWVRWLAADYRHGPVSASRGNEWDVSGGQTGASGSGSEAPLGCCEGPATLRQDAFTAEGLKS